jgi:hypothetical protein
MDSMMTNKSKTLAVVATVLILGAFLVLNSMYHFTGGHGRIVDALIARNVEARGGADAWQAVDSLQVSGQMDLGQGMHVPYTIEQKRPGKMCFEFVFDDETATQCVDGNSGWKLLPFRGRDVPEAMTEVELRDMANTATLDGLLFNSAERGYKVELVGKETIENRVAIKLQVTLTSGAVRWVYIDDETALDIKFESMRVLRGEERRVETFYSNWQETDGLLIARRQDTQTEGDEESHFLTVGSVSVNPTIDDSRFAMPATSGGVSQ